MALESRRFLAGMMFMAIWLLLCGCEQAAVREATPSLAPSVTPAPDPLAGTRWVLLSLNGQPPLEGSPVTLAFSGGFIRGSTGCNKVDRVVIGDDAAAAMYKATEDGSLTIPGLMVTQVECPPIIGMADQEKAYLDALRSVVAYRLVTDLLELRNAAGEPVLTFARQPSGPEQSPPGITPVPEVAFPQLRAHSTLHYDMPPLRGELVIENGCLRVKQDDGSSRLIIWQPGYWLHNNQGRIEVVDGEGQVVCRVGERIALGLAAADLEQQLREPLPTLCPEPFWVMDEIIK